MEDGNSAHGHKSTSNYYAKWRIDVRHYINAPSLYEP